MKTKNIGPQKWCEEGRVLLYFYFVRMLYKKNVHLIFEIAGDQTSWI